MNILTSSDFNHIRTALRHWISARATNSGTVIWLIRAGRASFTVRYPILAVSAHVTRNWKNPLTINLLHRINFFVTRITYHNVYHEDRTPLDSWRTNRHCWISRRTRLHRSSIASVLQTTTSRRSAPASARNAAI